MVSATDTGVTDKERLSAALEIWKKTVEVQQHFNDLSLRIRNFAITVLGGVFGVAGLILKDAPTSNVPAIVVLAGVFLCAAFYLMDALWYHKLLKGSVTAGISAEEQLQRLTGLKVSLGTDISIASVVTTWQILWPGQKRPAWTKPRRLRSVQKLDVFWSILFLVSLAVSAGLAFSAYTARHTPDGAASVIRTPTVRAAEPITPAPVAPDVSRTAPSAAAPPAQDSARPDE